MKKLFTYFLSAIMIVAVGCSESFDDSLIWEEINSLKDRVTTLEQLCKQMNTNISSLQTIVTALQNNDYVTNISPITEDGKTIGYTITFSKSGSVTIYHGKDGKDGANGKDGADGKDGINGTDGKNGADGYTPVIGVAKDTDGLYYWTLDGEWLLDNSGNKVKAQGVDGKDGIDGKDGADGKDGVDGKDGADGKDGKDGVNGTDGKDGVNGTDGKDGVTPKLKIENGYWYISYDNGSSWTQLDKATGENGQDGKDGDSMFKSVTYDDDYVYITLTDGTKLTLPRSGYQISNNEIWYTSIDGNIVEPNKSNAFGVNIVSNEYSNGKGVIKFDGKITTIGREAFYSCGRLTSITIPDSVTSIGNAAFHSCLRLTSITIPDSVTSIGSYAFTGCESLSAFHGKYVSADNRCLIIGNQLKSFAPAGLTAYTIPGSVTSIGDGAFGNTSLTSITIPDSVTSIGDVTFAYCTSLTSITIPDSVTSIGEGAFYNCI